MTTRDRPGRDPAPAASAAIFFVGGIWMGAWSTSGTAAGILLAISSVFVASWKVASAQRRVFSTTAVFLLFAAAGFLSGRMRLACPADVARSAYLELPRAAERADRVRGVLVDFWTGDPPSVHGRLRAEELWIGSQWRPFPAEVFLFVSGEEAPARVCERGDRVVAVGHLQPEGLPASDRDIPMPWPVYRLSIKSALRLESSGGTLVSALSSPNRWLSGTLPPRGSRGEDFDRNVRGPLASLLLGRTAELDRGMVGRYRRGGLYHLLVISGLHVALAAGLALGLLRAVHVRGKPRDAALLAAVAAFVLVGGANPPAVRAGLVFGVHRIARLVERPIGGLQAIGLSAVVLFGAAPGQIFSIGTILTFAAVCAIALFTAEIRRRLPERPRAVFSGVASAAAAQIGTAPVLLWRFNLVSAGAWLTGPICIPLAGGLIALGSVLLTSFALGWSAGPLAALFSLGSRALEWLAERASGAAFLRPTPPLAAVVSVSAMTWLAALAARRARPALAGAAVAGFLFLAVRPGAAGPARGFSIETLDVGQGDSILLRWRRHALLVDGGGPFDREARDFGRTRLLPKLLDRGVTRLDAALLTHPHPDHALGLFSILEELPVGAFWRSQGEDEGDFHRDLDRAARLRGVAVRRLAVGNTLRWRDASLRVLHSGGTRHKVDAINNQSVVALFERDGRTALLTGDAGAAAETELLRSPQTLSAEVLKVGHHGSRSSSTRQFLAAVSPKLALISCGRENRFGHPSPETLARLSERSIKTFRTDLSSDVRVELSGKTTHLWWRGLF